MTERFHFHFSLACIGEGNGNLLSVLAWRIPGTGEPGGLPSMGVAQSRTQLKRLSSMASFRRKTINVPVSFSELKKWQILQEYLHYH